MHLSRFLFIPAVLLLFQFIGCNCKNKTKTCPALNSTYKSYLSVEIGDTITYRNNIGTQTNFIVTHKNISEALENPCSNGVLNVMLKVAMEPLPMTSFGQNLILLIIST